MSKKQIHNFKFLIDQYKKTEDMQEILKKAKDALAEGNYTYFDMMLKKATLMSTKITYSLRKGCNDYLTDSKLKAEVKTRMSQIGKFDYHYYEDKIYMELPQLLNYRMSDKDNFNDPYVNMFNDIVYSDIKKFIKENNIKPYNEKITMCIINVVKEGTPKSWIPDLDNREYKNLINIIKQFFIRDDSPEFLSIHLDTVIGEDNKTLVCLLPEKSCEIVENLIDDKCKIISNKQVKDVV